VVEIAVDGDPAHGTESSRSAIRKRFVGGSDDAVGEDEIGGGDTGAGDGLPTVVGEDGRFPGPILMDILKDM
jgi:hypothetical protein